MTKMTDRAKRTLEEILKGVPEVDHFIVSMAFVAGYQEGRYQPTIDEALEECRKWRMTDEEEKALLE
jgi:hypothetical protein